MHNWQFLHKWTLLQQLQLFWIWHASLEHYMVNGVSLRCQLDSVATCRLWMPTSLTTEYLDKMPVNQLPTYSLSASADCIEHVCANANVPPSKTKQDSNPKRHGHLTRKEISSLWLDWLKSSLTSFRPVFWDRQRKGLKKRSQKRVKIINEEKIGNRGYPPLTHVGRIGTTKTRGICICILVFFLNSKT